MKNVMQEDDRIQIQNVIVDTMCLDTHQTNMTENILLKVEADGWGVICDCVKGKQYCINPLGLYIYRKLKDKESVNSLIESIKNKGLNLSDSKIQEIEHFVVRLKLLALI